MERIVQPARPHEFLFYVAFSSGVRQHFRAGSQAIRDTLPEAPPAPKHKTPGFLGEYTFGAIMILFFSCRVSVDSIRSRAVGSQRLAQLRRDCRQQVDSLPASLHGGVLGQCTSGNTLPPILWVNAACFFLRPLERLTPWILLDKARVDSGNARPMMLAPATLSISVRLLATAAVYVWRRRGDYQPRRPVTINARTRRATLRRRHPVLSRTAGSWTPARTLLLPVCRAPSLDRRAVGALDRSPEFLSRQNT